MKKPLVIAHRGASERAPENTLAAFSLARDLGADGIELDVHLSRDRVPVVIHDDTVERTTDGQGRVRALGILELKRLDAGGWKGEAFKGEKIPTLAEVVDALGDWLGLGARARLAQRGMLNIEMKTDSLWGGGLEAELVNFIAQRNLEQYVLVSSFNPLALARLKGLNPRIKRGLLYAPNLPLILRRAWLRPLATPYALHPHHSMVNEAYARWAGRKRYPINTWTVDESDAARRLARLGVNAIITNRPEEIRQAIQDASNK